MGSRRGQPIYRDLKPSPTQKDWLNFGWENFVALDWPALSPNSQGVMGQPDTNSKIGTTAANGALVPAVWNTFRDVSTLMLANGADPGATYNQPVTIASSCSASGSGSPVAPGFQPLYINNSNSIQAVLPLNYTNEAFTGPLVAQNGWYTLKQVFVAPSEYAYIQGNACYVGQNQVNAYNGSSKSLAAFPTTAQGMNLPRWAQYGALEVKATWRVLDQSDKAVTSRYYTQWGYFMQSDGKTCQGPTLFGLIGLHILRLIPSTGATWFWASFEQVDNTMPPHGIPPTLAAPNTPNGNCPSTPTPPQNYNLAPTAIAQGANINWNGSNPKDNICQVTQIPPEVQAVNKSWQSQLTGTVWQYYQMVNTINPCAAGAATCYFFPPVPFCANINVGTFYNTAIESYVQAPGATCMGCHGSAVGVGGPSSSQLTGTNQIFTFVLKNAYYTGPSAAQERDNLLRLFRNPLPSKLVAMPKANAGAPKPQELTYPEHYGTQRIGTVLYNSSRDGRRKPVASLPTGLRMVLLFQGAPINLWFIRKRAIHKEVAQCPSLVTIMRPMR